MLLFYALSFIIATIVLVRSGALLIRCLVNIARFMKWSEFLVSFILVGIGTSLPELFVGLGSAIKKAPSLSLGNVLGSNVLNLTLVAGLITIFAKGVEVRNRLHSRDAWLMFLLIIVPLLFLLNKTLSRLEGVLLLILFAGYLVYLFYQKKVTFVNGKLNKFNHISGFLKSIGFFVLALVLLLASAWLVSFSAHKLALGFNFPLVLAGVLLVALGTSLPELIFGVRSVLSGHEEMNIGNLFGSAVANSCLVLGITAIICPITIPSFAYFGLAGIFMLISVLVFIVFLRSQSYLSWWEGLIMISVYLLFIVLSLAL